MKVLLTGASGFVGRALQDEFRHGDGAYEVLALGREDGDLADDGVAETAMPEARPDVVVHAAARIGVVRCDEAPELALRSNVLATTLVARAAAAHGSRMADVSHSDAYAAPRAPTAHGWRTSRPRTSTARRSRPTSGPRRRRRACTRSRSSGASRPPRSPRPRGR